MICFASNFKTENSSPTYLFVVERRLVGLRAKELVDLDQHVDATVAQQPDDGRAQQTERPARVGEGLGHGENAGADVALQQRHQRLHRRRLVAHWAVRHLGRREDGRKLSGGQKQRG